MVKRERPKHKVGDLLLNITDLPTFALIKLTDDVKDFLYFKVVYANDPAHQLVLDRKFFHKDSVFSGDSWNLRTDDKARMFRAIFEVTRRRS